MTTDLPAPPVPADLDLRDFPFMPLKIEQLKRSKTWLRCKRRPELAFYHLNLWTAAWHELPAGSLDDDDDVLADLARCDPTRWDELKTDLLKDWPLHADGRRYHATVCAVALDAWEGKLQQRARTLKGRIAAMEKRLASATSAEDKQHLEALLKPLRHSLSQTLEQASEKRPRKSVTGVKGEGEGQGERKGQGQGQGQGDSKNTQPDGGPVEDPLEIPTFLKRSGPSGRAGPIAPDWFPSVVTQDALKKARPDLTEDVVKRRMIEFRNWCAETNKQTHNADATWFNFMVKTHVNSSKSAASSRGAGAAAAGIDEA